MKTKETDYVMDLLLNSGREVKKSILYSSNLNDSELTLLEKRFVNGLSLKECSDIFGIEINSVSKKQHKAIIKLYQYLIHN